MLQAVILSYGDHVTAAFSIGNKVSNLLLMPVLAMGSVLAAYVGQNIGAGNGERPGGPIWSAGMWGCSSPSPGACCSSPAGVLVTALTNDSATQAAAWEYMFWVLLTQPLMSLFQNYLGVFNGSGNTRFSFLMATARLWIIRLPLILLFKLFTDVGSTGIWYAMVLSNFIILIVGTLLFRRVSFTPMDAVQAAAEPTS